jgi:hypothetical protein
VERFGCRPVKHNHVECYDRATTTLLQARFPVRHANWPLRFVLVNLPFAVRILKRVGIERWKLEEEVSEKESFSLPTGQPQRCLNGCEKKRRPFRISIRVLPLRR